VIAFVTGAGRGIGANIARKLAEDGWEVVIAARTPGQVEAVAEEIGCRGVALDVSDREAGEQWPDALGLPADFDVVVANIIAGAIIDLAPHLAAALARGGRLIASGIIAEREALVIKALEAAGLHVESSRAMGEWRCLVAVRT